MNANVIKSRDNDRVRHARKVREGQITDEIFVEGVRLCEQAARANLEITDVLHTARLLDVERAALLLSELEGRFPATAVVSERVFASLSDMKTPQGLAVLAKRPSTVENGFERALENVPLLVIIHRLNNPSNAGAILRAAEAAGVTGVIATVGTTDLFSPKSLRGAMGSSFRLAIWEAADFSRVLAWCRDREIRTICADIRAERTHTEIDWTIPRALIVGPEANGLSDDEMALADEAARIPMHQPVESLNVAVAAAVMLYEAARQRQKL